MQIYYKDSIKEQLDNILEERHRIKHVSLTWEEWSGLCRSMDWDRHTAIPVYKGIILEVEK